ncbi:hypothetical protein BK816_03425 [Boudabousia tangfeifanii]|uniref:DUF58 domain-containing protein n=1 Tax=Boudabousia tangfeifanii TaxID=1912795 RepID=A0A1D9MJW0_9ACTO|nr:hypothetical protein BK816_03425 [Boudabousia tangfeifanii]
MRPYVIGDDVRDIDWRATARAREAIVKTWHPEKERQVTIINDAGRQSAVRLTTFPRYDTQLELSLLLASMAAKTGDKVNYLEVSNLVRARALKLKPNAVLETIGLAIANKEPELVETNWDLAFSTLRNFHRDGGLIIVLTALDLAMVPAGLLLQLQNAAKRSTVLLISVTDQTVETIANSEIKSEYTSFQRAAATYTLVEQNNLASTLASYQVTSLTGDESSIATKAAEKYVWLKRHGLF